MNTPFNIPWQKYPEDFVISELLKSSKQFYEFYTNERSKIVGPVVWVQSESLPNGISARVSRKPSGKLIIRIIHLRKVPATIDDAYNVAHELAHLICDVEGFQL